MTNKFLKIKSIAVIQTLTLVGVMSSAIPVAWSADGKGTAVDVVELFTSQGCSSCPSADKLLGELIAENPDLVALEFHVDYWDKLVHGGDGSWADPYSDAAYTERQREYDFSRLSGRQGVYTPQMVINGEYAAVGSDRARIVAQLGHNTTPIKVNTRLSEDNKLLIELDNPEQHRSQLWLATYILSARTEITAGENRHVTLDNHHIVKSLEPLEKVEDASLSLSVPYVLNEGEGCAVLVQSRPLQPILGAAQCP